MATDYDTPRKTDEELHEESLEELKAKRVDAQSGQIDVDEAEAAENLELPGADLSGEELVEILEDDCTIEFANDLILKAREDWFNEEKEVSNI